jgi:hypothetical protein
MQSEKLVLKTIADMTILLSHIAEGQAVMGRVLLTLAPSLPETQQRSLKAAIVYAEAQLPLLQHAGETLKARL